MTRVKFAPHLDHLPIRVVRASTVIRDAVINVPLPHAFERIVAWEQARVPELEKLAAGRIGPATARMQAQHTIGAPLAGAALDRRAPRAAVVLREAIEGGVDGIGAGPMLFDGEQITTARPRVPGIGHDRHAFSGRSAKHLAADGGRAGERRRAGGEEYAAFH